jgi:hypothetical protein
MFLPAAVASVITDDGIGSLFDMFFSKEQRSHFRRNTNVFEGQRINRSDPQSLRFLRRAESPVI